MIERPRVPAGTSAGGQWMAAHGGVGAASGMPSRGNWGDPGAPTPKRDLNNIKWVQPKRAKYEAMVEVDVEKLDALWRKDQGGAWRIDETGANAIGNRLQRFEEWLNSTTDPVETPEVSFTDFGAIAFTNGRHRFSYFRDHGVKTVKVSIPKGQAERLRKEAGRG